MCGIAGILRMTAGEVPRQEELQRMVVQLHHRGPDGTGFHLDGDIGLAHARLSIIDLAGGGQPIHNENKDVWVTFNGEIFNYVELTQQLVARGHRFYTQSDTEVIVHLYEEYGDSFVEHLNGQFALALWDATRHRLLLARDRVGIRPLFYTESDGRLLFASEIKALFAIPSVPRRLDTTALAEVATFWAPLASRSAFAGISSLPPGHCLIIERRGLRLKQYWDWVFPDSQPASRRGEADYADELKSLLVDAVRLQLRADVPVGAYLSGGLDSSIIATIIRRYSNTPLRTFSLTFEDGEFDESAQQQQMSAALDTHHTSVRCQRSDIAALFPATIYHAESPIVRTAPTPLMLLSRHVRESGFKVVLTGEGADEVFGGYDLFKEAKIRRFWARQPASAMRPRILERLYPYLKHSPSSGRAFTESFFREGIDQASQPWFAHLPRWTTTARMFQFFSSDLRASIAGWDGVAAIRATLPTGIENWLPLGRDQYIEAHTLMSGYLLSSQGDRVAMANSVEGRVPFLDHRLIEFANRLPPQLKLQGLTEKYLLKKCMQGEMPEAIRRRTKQPYRAPDSQSFFNDGKPVSYVNEILGEKSISAAGYFDPAAVGKLVRKCAAGRVIGFADNMAFVTILSTMLLHHQFILGENIDSTHA